MPGQVNWDDDWAAVNDDSTHSTRVTARVSRSGRFLLINIAIVVRLSGMAISEGRVRGEWERKKSNLVLYRYALV